VTDVLPSPRRQVSNVISQTVVKKLNGLAVIAPLLRSPKINLQRNTVALVANLAKNPSLANPIGRRPDREGPP
jgi:hypothetical protein